MENNIVLSVKCPHCGTSLIDQGKMVRNHPGIKINIVTDSNRGILWLCPVYGCFAHDSDISLAKDEVVKFFCPHCNKSLLINQMCDQCGAPMVAMNIKIGGKVNICSRNGCNNHFMVFEDPNDALGLFYDKYDNITKK
ncbi:MAG: hypothetical protein RBS37_07540 [Bacteroidales bacterium]|jgi:predicted RNA-binding Zn-ribbon protein involved in translation (DUF1610 family)|nr:hypothetical protein [Bacteroidales bacterium]